jgi:hypothetical protein
MKPQRMVGDFDCSGADIERDWAARTSCWSSVERIALTYGQTQAYALPAADGMRDNPRWLHHCLQARVPFDETIAFPAGPNAATG